ncbi:MAG: 4Fe-4S binding protein [Myxococcales bacterium]|nr:4Fe-4S binding protein [Myxococcales bacterium]
MKARDLPGWARDTALRMLPHSTATGLRAVGRPGPDAPVLVTGNFTLTVRRLRDALAGLDAWILVANSRGINVWCAAGGGHMTHHDVIAAIRTSRLAERVDHREVILPQLAATGVERRKVTDATGFKTRWGPASLDDLPAFLARGQRVAKAERFVRFPLWERMEMASIWYWPMAALVAVLFGLIWGARALAAAEAGLTVAVFGLFSLLPWLPVTTWRRWLVLSGAAVVGTGIGLGLLALLGDATTTHLIAVTGACVVSMAILSIDLAGTTPWNSSTLHMPAQIELIEDRCTGAADCVQVCPRDVLQMNGKRRLVEIRRPEQCIQCGACIVQCPEDALRFRYADGRVVEAATIRKTRVNLLGKRSVQVRE